MRVFGFGRTQFLLAAVTAVGLMGSARAGTIEVFGGAPGSEPLGSATNDIIGAQLGYLASNLTATGPGTIQFTFIRLRGRLPEFVPCG